jgi:hypothetical protein
MISRRIVLCFLFLVHPKCYLEYRGAYYSIHERIPLTLFFLSKFRGRGVDDGIRKPAKVIIPINVGKMTDYCMIAIESSASCS